MDNYKITHEDGSEQILQLDDDDAKAWKDRADDKNSDVKSVAKGEPEPINAKAAKA